LNAKTRTIGRDPECDLVLEGTGVSRLHARLLRDADHTMWVEDAESENGIELQRNRQWITVRRASLCVGDRLRVGGLEVPLERLSALFGGDDAVRLRPMRVPALSQLQALDEPPSASPDNSRLVRNPLTGVIEEGE
jgi:pSer/pThr/pTyr-binding forkhead associated (FHA) protein